MPFEIAVCPSLLVYVALQFVILYFLIKVYQGAAHWTPRLQTPVRGSAQEVGCRVLIGHEADVGPSEAQSIPHNHRTPRAHDERQIYQRTEFWAPRQQTPVRGSAQEESCRVLIGEEADVGPSEAQSIAHNHRTPREHDERQTYQRTEFWAPRQQTPVRGSAQEESCRVLIGEEANVGPSEAQSIPHNHRTPREHDERQSSNESSSAVDGMIQ